MTIIESQVSRFKIELEQRAADYQLELSEVTIAQLGKYYDLLSQWNTRLHLVSPSSPEEFATRHVLESLLLIKHLPLDAHIADVGSGGGLPIIPCLIARSDLHAIVFEASKKKAVFLREAVRAIDTEGQVKVVAERFETVATPAVGFVSCRAIERFETTLPLLLRWAPANCTLLLFGGMGLGQAI